VILNYGVKLSFGRPRPLLEDHPPLAKAPSNLSFPSAHSTSSMAAATALGRVDPRTRVPLYLLATSICVSRPYLGMHYPSDVVAGALFGLLIGGIVPAVGERTLEERMADFVADLGHDEAPITQPDAQEGSDPDPAPANPSNPDEGSGPMPGASG